MVVESQGVAVPLSVRPGHLYRRRRGAPWARELDVGAGRRSLLIGGIVGRRRFFTSLALVHPGPSLGSGIVGGIPYEWGFCIRPDVRRETVLMRLQGERPWPPGVARPGGLGPVGPALPPSGGGGVGPIEDEVGIRAEIVRL